MANQMPGMADIKAYLRGTDLDPTAKPSNPLQYGRDLEDFKTYQGPSTQSPLLSKPKATFDPSSNLDLFS